MKLTLAGINTVKRNGKTYYYWRATGKRIEGEPGTAAFFLSMEEAKRAEEEAPGETLEKLLLAYERSEDYRKLAVSTKDQYQRFLRLIRQRYGKVELSAFSDKRIKGDVLEWRDIIARNSRSAADHMMRTFKVVLSFGEDRGIIDRNYLAGIGKVYSVDRSDKIWGADQIKKLIEVGPLEMGYAIRLALLTGQRSEDLRRWAWSDYRKGGLYLRGQQKTLEPISLPTDGALGAFLDSLPRTAETILTNTNGRPWNESWFRMVWRQTRAKAGYGESGLSFHDLRGTAITTLADLGCTEVQIAAFTGHTSAHVSIILRRYLKRTTTQAKASMKAINESWIGGL